VTGSRTWLGHVTIARVLRDTVRYRKPSSVTIVHGGAYGADRIAHDTAKVLGYQTEVHPADWNTHGKAAGPIRNKEMVEAGADICLAFIRDNSRGATHCADLAEAAGIPTQRYEWKGN
jgi:hypothetical protein